MSSPPQPCPTSAASCAQTRAVSGAQEVERHRAAHGAEADPADAEIRHRRSLGYLCLKAGFRFSTNAAIPSFWSSVAKSEWNSRRSNRMPSPSGLS